ncbi:kinesin-like protein KIF19 isoform X2 [Lineus longissimus]|uniref:kinesin-like protein KIF19 isoform X2 n=1 Tax=Lineus longissimus TaxID=88925 RepID=UPI002B4C40EA
MEAATAGAAGGGSKARHGFAGGGIGGEQNLMVALRIRPLSEDEILHGATQITHQMDNRVVVLMDPTEDPEDVLRANRSREKQFVFDVAFDGNASQKEVYLATTKYLIEHVVNGYNATVFAYGATGAGKTYTMLGTDDGPGIMVQTLNELFNEMEKTKRDTMYSVSMSYLEIYNEMIRDLLNTSSGYLDLREDHKGVQVAGLTEIQATSTGEVMKLLKRGNKERTQEPTAANPTSSRSHAVLQVIVKQRDRVKGTTDEVRLGRLYLIDLAGSERASNTLNRGKRMVEGAHINRSLLALGNCINALSTNNNRYINYRDSKLTRLLKDALGGNCKTVMIAHISPASLHFEESRNTLIYADRAKNIKTKVRRNVTDVSYHIAQYTNIIQELRQEIERLRYKLTSAGGSAKKRNVSNIQNVQDEVMESSRKMELKKMKEQLLTTFRDQMEVRRSLMEITNTQMDISLEFSRNTLIINDWETEHAKQRRRESVSDNRYREFDKEQDLHGNDEPQDVSLARAELRVLQEEKDRTHKLKGNLQKELNGMREKAKKVEEVLPKKISRDEEREILSLLCRVHELEIENTEMESLVFLKDHELRKKDLQIQRFQQRRNLCDEIIHQQRVLITVNNIDCPKELEELYDLYQLELDMPVSPDASLTNVHQPYKATSISSINKRLMGENNIEGDSYGNLSNKSSPSKKSFGNITKEEEYKIFSQSPKTRHIKEAQLMESRKNNSKRTFITDPDKDSIFTLSSRGETPVDDTVFRRTHHSDVVLPTNLSMSVSQNFNREQISTNTRNIAALAAAKRRNLIQGEADRLSLPETGIHKSQSTHGVLSTDTYLTASRLAKHDQNFGAPASHRLDDNTSERHSIVTQTTVGYRRATYDNTKKKQNEKNENKRKAKTEVYGGYQLSKTNPRGGKNSDLKNVNNRVAKKKITNATRLPPPPEMNKNRLQGESSKNEGDVQQFEPLSTPPSIVYQSAPDKGKGLALQKRYRAFNNGSESSAASTPQLNEPNKRSSRKPPPSIPSTYRKGDISITGYKVV